MELLFHAVCEMAAPCLHVCDSACVEKCAFPPSLPRSLFFQSVLVYGRPSHFFYPCDLTSCSSRGCRYGVMPLITPTSFALVRRARPSLACCQANCEPNDTGCMRLRTMTSAGLRESCMHACASSFWRRSSCSSIGRPCVLTSAARGSREGRAKGSSQRGGRSPQRRKQQQQPNVGQHHAAAAVSSYAGTGEEPEARKNPDLYSSLQQVCLQHAWSTSRVHAASIRMNVHACMHGALPS